MTCNLHVTMTTTERWCEDGEKFSQKILAMYFLWKKDNAKNTYFLTKDSLGPKHQCGKFILNFAKQRTEILSPGPGSQGEPVLVLIFATRADRPFPIAGFLVTKSKIISYKK